MYGIWGGWRSISLVLGGVGRVFINFGGGLNKFHLSLGGVHYFEKKSPNLGGGLNKFHLSLGGGLITLKFFSCAARAIVLIIATFKLHFPSKINHMKLTTSIMLI